MKYGGGGIILNSLLVECFGHNQSQKHLTHHKLPTKWGYSLDSPIQQSGHKNYSCTGEVVDSYFREQRIHGEVGSLSSLRSSTATSMKTSSTGEIIQERWRELERKIMILIIIIIYSSRPCVRGKRKRKKKVSQGLVLCLLAWGETCLPGNLDVTPFWHFFEMRHNICGRPFPSSNDS